MFFVAAVACLTASRAVGQQAERATGEIRVDANYAGGNIIVQRLEGSTLYVRQDLRDTDGWWFYWNFRVSNAADQQLRVQFDDPSPIGVRGPAISRDQGRTWSWLGADSMSGSAFECTLAAEDNDVRFAFAIPYQLADWQRFVAAQRARHTAALTEDTLCKTRQGRPVPLLRAAPRVESTPRRVLLTARHHACESLANYVLEGVIETWLAQRTAGDGPPGDVELLVVPLVDLDGVENGDQGKNRRPRDHNRDYDGDGVHPETRAVRQLVAGLPAPALEVAIDVHCPWIRGAHNDVIYMVGSADPQIASQQQQLGRLLEAGCQGALPYKRSNNIPFGTAWNTASNFKQGTSFSRWAGSLPGIRLATSFEVPYASASGQEVNAQSARAFGRDLARALFRYLKP